MLKADRGRRDLREERKAVESLVPGRKGKKPQKIKAGRKSKGRFRLASARTPGSRF